MEEIIKQLEEKKKRLEEEQHNIDLKIIKIVGVINDLEEYGIDEPKEKVSTTKKKKKVIYSDDPRLKKVPSKKKGKSGGGKPVGEKMFPKEVNEFIKKNWEGHTDLELARFIMNKFDRKYTREQIKGNRRTLGCFSDTIGRKKEQKVIINNESDEKPLKVKKKYPKEMEDFIKEQIEGNSSKELVDLINEKYDVEITLTKLAAYLSYKKIKRRPKSERYSPEAVQFIKENLENFSNKEICRELKTRFNIKTVVASLQNFMYLRGISRKDKSNIDPRIVNFIRDSKTKDPLVLRDEIIERFEKNISMDIIKGLMKENLPGESVKKGEYGNVVGSEFIEEDDDSIDGMDLG